MPSTTRTGSTRSPSSSESRYKKTSPTSTNAIPSRLSQVSIPLLLERFSELLDLLDLLDFLGFFSGGFSERFFACSPFCFSFFSLACACSVDQLRTGFCLASSCDADRRSSRSPGPCCGPTRCASIRDRLSSTRSRRASTLSRSSVFFLFIPSIPRSDLSVSSRAFRTPTG